MISGNQKITVTTINNIPGIEEQSRIKSFHDMNKIQNKIRYLRLKYSNEQAS